MCDIGFFASWDICNCLRGQCVLRKGVFWYWVCPLWSHSCEIAPDSRWLSLSKLLFMFHYCFFRGGGWRVVIQYFYRQNEDREFILRCTEQIGTIWPRPSVPTSGPVCRLLDTVEAALEMNDDWMEVVAFWITWHCVGLGVRRGLSEIKHNNNVASAIDLNLLMVI